MFQYSSGKSHWLSSAGFVRLCMLVSLNVSKRTGEKEDFFTIFLKLSCRSTQI